jgi:polyisoprenoid-binding protein YceI
MTTAFAQPLNEIATRWQIDAAHSNVEFAVRHLMISTVKGRFGDIVGAVTLDPENPDNSAIEVTLQTASVDTRQDQRDAHLRSADFFDAEKYPAITFRSTRVEGDTDSEFQVFGDLTIRDVTREIVLDVTKDGQGGDPWGNQRAAFSAKTRIDRRDFGLTYNQVLETGGVVVGDEIKISVDVELTAVPDTDA